MLRLKYDHIYECYPVYQLFFGRERATKAHDALTAVLAIARWQELPKCPKQFRVLELFAGQSEHKEHLLAQLYDPSIVKSYTCLDINITKNDGSVVKGDARTFDYSDYNLVLAFYYSMSSTFVQDAEVHGAMRPREQLDAFTRRVADTLPNHSALFLHIGKLDHRKALDYGSDEPEFDTWRVRKGHPLCALVKHQANLLIRVRITKSYDRALCCVLDHISKLVIKDEITEKTVAEIVIERPFVQRFWTEPEITDSLYAAGFSRVEHFSNQFTYNDGPYELLERKVAHPDAPESEDEAEPYVASELLAIKN